MYIFTGKGNKSAGKSVGMVNLRFATLSCPINKVAGLKSLIVTGEKEKASRSTTRMVRTKSPFFTLMSATKGSVPSVGADLTVIIPVELL